MDDLRHIQGKKITVLGAARSGLAAARLMAERGASVFLSEMDSVENKGKEADLLKQAGIPAEFGGHSPRIYDADLWVVSPGIPPTAKTIQEAKKRSIPIVGELEMASRFCRAPIVAVTGSNGKSTVTALLGEVFHTSGRPCVVAGNIGQPFSDVVEKTVEEGVAVLEVSSFQLETVQTFHPRLAVFLNLTPDHLDRHGTMKAYGQLKARMFENQQNSDILVYNGCDTRVESLASTSKGIISVFGKEDGAADCAFVRDDRLICRVGGTEECILACSEMGIRGEHTVISRKRSGISVACLTAWNPFVCWKGLNG